MTGEPPFRRRTFFDEADLVGARWWQESLAIQVNPVTRRSALTRIALVLAGVGAIGLTLVLTRRKFITPGSSTPPSAPVLRDALELQKEQGWDVGRAGGALDLRGVATVDFAGAADWAEALPTLAEALAPASPSLAPFYVPTLFQALVPPSSAGLRAAISPIHDDEMDAAYGRGEALAELVTAADAPPGTAVLVDLPGPIAVAVAAGLAERLEPVFLFDNWPHPAGVVPSHHTLAAAVYYRPHFLAARASRKGGAPPVFVADDRRLAAYTDEGDRFDNRYLLRLPSADSLARLNIKRLLYVRPTSGQIELDDLNDDFVELAKAGVDVKIVALDDFKTVDADTAPATPRPAQAATATNRYHWGGHPGAYIYFWPSYGYGRVRAAPSAPPPPARVGAGASYTPAPRTTMFSSRTLGGTAGVGRQKPTGFGRVSVGTTSGSGTSSTRSGSWGRTTTSYGG